MIRDGFKPGRRTEPIMARRTPRVLTGEQWELLAPPSPKGGRLRADDRECLEVLSVAVAIHGRWRDIPVDLPSGSTAGDGRWTGPGTRCCRTSRGSWSGNLASG